MMVVVQAVAAGLLWRPPPPPQLPCQVVQKLVLLLTNRTRTGWASPTTLPRHAARPGSSPTVANEEKGDRGKPYSTVADEHLQPQ